MKSKAQLFALIFVTLFLAGCAVPDLSFTEAVTVYYANGQEELTIKITDANDVSELVRALTEDTESGSGNCDFSQLKLLFEGQNKTFGLHPATDGCNTVFYRENGDCYYMMNSENKKVMLDILAQYEIPLDYEYLDKYVYER